MIALCVYSFVPADITTFVSLLFSENGGLVDLTRLVIPLHSRCEAVLSYFNDWNLISLTEIIWMSFAVACTVLYCKEDVQQVAQAKTVLTEQEVWFLYTRTSLCGSCAQRKGSH